MFGILIMGRIALRVIGLAKSWGSKRLRCIRSGPGYLHVRYADEAVCGTSFTIEKLSEHHQSDQYSDAHWGGCIHQVRFWRRTRGLWDCETHIKFIGPPPR